VLAITKVIETDVPPPGAGLVRVIVAVPALAMSDAGTLAWIEVALT